VWAGLVIAAAAAGVGWVIWRATSESNAMNREAAMQRQAELTGAAVKQAVAELIDEGRLGVRR
jgi:hypothetical protein